MVANTESNIQFDDNMEDNINPHYFVFFPGNSYVLGLWKHILDGIILIKYNRL